MITVQQLVRDIKNLWKLHDTVNSVNTAAADIAALNAVDLACDAYNANPSEATAQAVVDADSNLLDRIRDWFADKAGAVGSLVDFNFDATKLINQQRDDAYLTEYLYKNKILREKYQDPRVDTRCKSAADAAKAVLPPRRDPLTFDLDGDGLETTAIAATNPILFDHDGDGVKNGTGWVKPDDGFLVRDVNGNGTIDNGRELFGDSTIKSNGQTATDGFDALADLDSNADGKISSLDTQFNNLRLWRDLNQDGISQTGELFTLSSQNITGINVAKTANSQTLPNGNQIADLGSFTRTDGTTGSAGAITGNLADINLASDTFHRSFPNVLNTTSVATLPDMQGSGKVRDLREAATQSTTLQTLLTNYSATTTRAGQMALIDQLLDAWADTGGLAETMSQRIAANDAGWRIAA